MMGIRKQKSKDLKHRIVGKYHLVTKDDSKRPKSRKRSKKDQLAK